MTPPGSFAGYGAIAVISPLDHPMGALAWRSPAHPVTATSAQSAGARRNVDRVVRVDERIRVSEATPAPHDPSENRRRFGALSGFTTGARGRGCVRATRLLAPSDAAVRAEAEMRPGGLEPPTCGFSDPSIARRAGPSLRPRDHEDAGRFDAPIGSTRLRGGIAGAAHPLVSTPSVGRAVRSDSRSGAHPADGSARDCPRLRARGVPRIHPVRLGPSPGRAPLFRAHRWSMRALVKETAALSC